MPFGPRPEPPPISREEVSRHSQEYQFSQLALNLPEKAPKGLLLSKYTGSVLPKSVFDDDSCLSGALPNAPPGSSPRLKGPRPLFLHQKSPSRSSKPIVPYPLAENASASQSGQESDHFNSNNIFTSFGSSILQMPEPEDNRAFVSPSPSMYSLSQTSVSLKEHTGAASSSLSNPPEDQHPSEAFSMVPPPLTSKIKYARPTRSIFQWGIPAELLPPMPVSLEAMSGLHVGQEGQYTMSLDLPQIPSMDPIRPKFSVEQLTISDFQSPKDLWSLSQTARWLYELVLKYDSEISVEDAQQALTRLFLYRISTLDWTRAKRVASSVILSLKQQSFIAQEMLELVLTMTGPQVSGVITEFSGNNGCYSPSLPSLTSSTHCYSFSCLRELHSSKGSGGSRQISSRSIARSYLISSVSGQSRSNTQISGLSATTTIIDVNELKSDNDIYPLRRLQLERYSNLMEDDPSICLEMNWRKFWNLEESDMADVDPTIVKAQFAIHELIMSEVLYVRDLQIYLDVYGDIELLNAFAIMSKQAEFTSRVFDRIKAILHCNRNLLSNLLIRQNQQGPYVQCISDILGEWASQPSTIDAYSEYATDYLWADNHLRRELAQSQHLQKWMEERAKNTRLMGRPHSFFFNRVLPRVARYHLLLGTILKYTEKIGLESDCIVTRQAIEAANALTQRCDDSVSKQKRVLDVQNLKAHIVFKSSSVTADLKLGDKRRRLIRRGDMLRRGELKMDWVETHALLLDNFLVLSKTREGYNGTAFYVTKPPIPLDLLVLESCEEEGVVKVSSKIAFTRHGSTEEPENKGELVKSPTLFPLRITHLGSGGQKYQFFVSTKPERSQWANSIVEAKQFRAQLAFTRSAEPFRFDVVSDHFKYPDTERPQLPIPIPGTSLHRAVGWVDPDNMSRVALKRRVNCSATVGLINFLGTDGGLWAGLNTQDSSELIWKNASLPLQKIIKIDILETMNAIFILCGDRNLTWFPLDQVISRCLGDTRKTIGIRLNRTKKVVDFTIGYHKSRVVVIYLQQGGLLKVVEPVRSHGALSMRILKEHGLQPATKCIDSLREIDRVQVGAEAVRITAFLKSIIVTSLKSFEWLTLDSKKLVRIPSGSNRKEMQFWGRPIRTIKLDAARVLMCYESCYVMCDYTGNVGIQPTTWFLEKCTECAYYAPYLIVVAQGGELVEIRYVDEFPGRLVQILTGKDIKVLNVTEEPIHLRMAHPWAEGRQLILELIGNDVVKTNGSTWVSSSSA